MKPAAAASEGTKSRGTETLARKGGGQRSAEGRTHDGMRIQTEPLWLLSMLIFSLGGLTFLLVMMIRVGLEAHSFNTHLQHTPSTHTSLSDGGPLGFGPSGSGQPCSHLGMSFFFTLLRLHLQPVDSPHLSLHTRITQLQSSVHK